MSEALTAQKCIACEGGTPPLTLAEAERYLAETPGWTLSEDTLRLSRDWKFRDFKEAVSFLNRVADLAEAEGHHPDMRVSWNKVRLDLTTHAVKGLSKNDFILAAKINALP